MNKDIEELIRASICKGILLSLASLYERAMMLRDTGQAEEGLVVVTCINELKKLKKQYD